jgi:hypothetical protein
VARTPQSCSASWAATARSIFHSLGSRTLKGGKEDRVDERRLLELHFLCVFAALAEVQARFLRWPGHRRVAARAGRQQQGRYSIPVLDILSDTLLLDLAGHHLSTLVIGADALKLLIILKEECQSVDSSAIFMNDTPNKIKNKINKHAFSGGQDTAELHKPEAQRYTSA